jgi:hypothetical protein
MTAIYILSLFLEYIYIFKKKSSQDIWTLIVSDRSRPEINFRFFVADVYFSQCVSAVSPPQSAY